MSTLNSSSTTDQVKAAYIDSASYEEDNSPTKARAFVTSCRILLLKLPKQAGLGSGQVQLSPELVRAEMQRATDWLSVNDRSNNRGVRHLSLGGLRS